MTKKATAAAVIHGRLQSKISSMKIERDRIAEMIVELDARMSALRDAQDVVAGEMESRRRKSRPSQERTKQ